MKINKSKILDKNNSNRFHFSRTELRSILDIIQKNLYVIFVWSNEKGWPVEYVSENVKDVFGYTAKEFINREILYSDTIYPEDLLELQKHQVSVVDKKCKNQLTVKSYRIIDKHGSLHYVEDRTRIVCDPDGNIFRLQGVVQDITDRKKVEEELIFRLKLEKEISKISSYIIQSDSKDIKKMLSFAANHISSFIESDYCCVVLKNQDTEKLSIVYEYSKLNKNLISLHFHEKSLNKFNYYSNNKRNNVKIIKNINLIKNDFADEKEFYQNCSVKSYILIPFMLGKVFVGYLGFYFINRYSKYSEKDVAVFNLFTNMLSNAYKNYHTFFERKKIEAKVQQLNQAVNQSANSIVITDFNGNIEYVNPKFEKITEYSRKEVIGKNSRILKSGHTKPAEYKKLWDTITKGKTWKGEFKNISKSGKIFWESATITPMRNNKNEITHFLAIKEDITEKISVQNQLALAQKMESIGMLAAGIAHEINTPLQYVGDNINFLSDSYKAMTDVIFDFSAFFEDGNNYNEDEIREFYQNKKEEMDLEFILEEIPEAIYQTKEGINKVTKIVGAMKDFSHPGAKKKAFYDLNKGIEDTIIISKNEWKYVADVEMNLDKSIKAVYCLLDELNQVFLNLIVNAAHAIEEKLGEKPQLSDKGKIIVETIRKSKPGGDYIIITIKDSGNGIKKENINKIFDPFFTTKEVGKGTGQGLAIAHDIIVNKHEGNISVESEVGKGTTFRISFPIEPKKKENK